VIWCRIEIHFRTKETMLDRMRCSSCLEWLKQTA
jgi:hypothetical protein